MTFENKANSAYGTLQSAIASPKRGEYGVFARVTSRLNAANGPKPAIGQRAAAIHENRTLWIEIGTQVADDDNALPFELRQRLFSLSIFVQQYSGDALTKGSDLGPLIEINRRIMAGLQENKGIAA